MFSASKQGGSLLFGSRLFSTTPAAKARSYKHVVKRHHKEIPVYKEGDVKPWYVKVPEVRSKYPEYPYGEARLFKRSDRGLFGGQMIGSGHQVSEMGNKTPRAWLPNVISKRLWSDALNKTVKMHLTARVLRTITKEGGLDNYVTKEKAARIKELGIFGWRLRYDVLKAREASTLPPSYKVTKDAKGKDVKIYHKGTYQGKPVELTVGRRKLLSKLFPVVKNNTPEELHFGKFSVDHATTPFDDILKECEQYSVDLTDVVLAAQ